MIADKLEEAENAIIVNRAQIRGLKRSEAVSVT